MQGRALVYMRVSKMVVSLGGPSIESFQKMMFYLLSQLIEDPAVQIRGIAVVFDLTELSFTYFMRHVGTRDIQRGVGMFQGTFPARTGAIYVLHEPGWIGSLLGMVKPFVSSYLFTRLHFLGDDYTR